MFVVASTLAVAMVGVVCLGLAAMFAAMAYMAFSNATGDAFDTAELVFCYGAFAVCIGSTVLTVLAFVRFD